MTAYSSFKNCEDDPDELITCEDYVEVVPDEKSQAMMDTEENDSIYKIENSYRKSKKAKNRNSKNAALRYTVGFTIFKIIGNRLGCQSCLKLMTFNSICKALDETLIKHTNFSTTKQLLTTPSNRFFAITKIHLNAFEYFFSKFLRVQKDSTKNNSNSHFEDKLHLPGLVRQDESLLPPPYRVFKIFDHRAVLLKKNCNWYIKNYGNSYSHLSKIRIIKE